MNLFPQTKDFISGRLLNLDENQIRPLANNLHRNLSRTSNFFRDISYDDLLQAFNKYFIWLTNEGEVDENNFDEIKSLIDKGEILFGDGFIKLRVSNYDVCALLLIIKIINEVNPDNIQNTEYFLNEIVNRLDNRITSQNLINNDSLIDFLSYNNIQSDLLICFALRNDINRPTFHELIDGKYSYLFLNEVYKEETYRSLDLDNGPIIEPNSNNFNQFKEDLLTYNSRALTYNNNQWAADREIVLQAVEINGLALEYASENLKSDRDIVYTAVSNNPSSLKFASNDILNDVLLAIRGNIIS